MTSFFQKLCTMDALHEAWLEVKAKGSAGGIDGHDIKSFAQDEGIYLAELCEELKSGVYVSEPYYHIQIPKSTGSKEKRSLGLLTIRDKVAQQAVRKLIEPVFEKQFIDVSYGYRPLKGPARAIKRVRHRIVTEKRTWVTLCDIDNYFDTVNHSILFEKIKANIQETEIPDLVRLWTRMGQVDKQGRWKDREEGIAQGGILSPLFSNVYLHEFDLFMVKQNYGLIRYSDDFIILSHDQQTANQALKDAQEYLLTKLALKLNPNPAVRSVQQGFTYMGFFFQGENIKIDSDKFYRIKTKIKFLCIDHLNRPLSDFVHNAKLGMQSLNSYYKPLAPEYQLQALDDYFKRQVTILVQKKKYKGELKSKSEAYNELKNLKPVQSKSYEQMQEYIQSIIDSAWPNKMGQAHRKHFDTKQKQPDQDGLAKEVVQQQKQPDQDGMAAQMALKTSKEEEKAPAKVEDEQQGAPFDYDKPAPVESNKETQSVDQKVARKKRQYVKKRILTANLVITKPGHFVGCRKDMIVIKKGKDIVEKIAASKVEHLSIMAHGVTLSSDLIQLCVDRKIPVDFFDFKGEPTAKLFLPQVPDTQTSLAQLKAFENGKCYEIASTIVESKIDNHINVLKYFLRHRKKADKDFVLKCETAFNKMERAKEKALNLERIADQDLYRNRLMAHEGEAATAYWDTVSLLLKDDVVFEKRVRHGATDVVNNCLNYGYGILYPRLWQAVIEAGLNPMISFLHKSQPGKPTLTYDLIEEFRQQVVDRTVFSLFTKGKTLNMANNLLSTSTRNTVMNSIIERLKSPVRFRGSRLTFEEIMSHQAKQLAEFLVDKRKTYNPFVGTY